MPQVKSEEALYKTEAIRLRLRKARKDLGLTQKQVSLHTGIAQSFISEFENGKRMMSVYDIMLLCLEYGQSPEYIFAGAKPAEKQEAPDAEDDYHALAMHLSSLPGGDTSNIAHSFITLNLYYLVRCLYKANPRHKSTRAFRLDDVAALKLLESAYMSLHAAISGRMMADRITALSIEPAPDEAEVFRRLIAEVENSVLNDTPPQEQL